MKIAFVSEHASPLAAIGGVDAGGQNVHVAELAAGLVRLGHRVTVYTRRDAADPADRVRSTAGYDVVHLAAGPARPVGKDELWPWMPDFAGRLTEELLEDRADLVHAHFWMSAWAAEVACRTLGLPLAVTFHALGAVKRRHLGAADASPDARVGIEARLAAVADRVIATCTDEVAELARQAPDRALVSVVPCGVDLTRFTPTGPREGDRSHPHRLVSLGRLVPRKGLEQVIEALTRLPSAELVIAGGEPGVDQDRLRLAGLARGLGVADRVRLRSQVPRSQVPALLRSADVVVCAPWYEPFGIVPVEAMACGVPVVASAVGGMLDTVAPGVTGLLVPPRDPESLAGAIGTLLGDRSLRHRMGGAAAVRARAHYSWDRVASRTAEIYAAVLQAGPARAELEAAGWPR